MYSANRAVKTFYYQLVPNVGDLLTGIIAKHMFNIELKWSKQRLCEFMGIGSILDLICVNNPTVILTRLKMNIKKLSTYITPLNIWSSGFMRKPEEEFVSFYRKNISFTAVRGKLSQEIIEKIYIPIPNVVLGDAGLLASLLMKYPEKEYAIGIIPHYSEIYDPQAQKIMEYYKNAKLIDVRENPMHVIKEIASCEVILSSSLHGLVIADSFHIPNQHIVFSDMFSWQEFKYRDYYSAYDLPHIFFDTRTSCDYPSINKIIDDYQIRHGEVVTKQKQLIECFPYQ